MKPLTDKHVWPEIAVYDIEATEWTNIICLCHVDEFGNRKMFRNRSDYVDWLFTKFPGEVVWAHWGGRYDHQFLIAEAHKRGWSGDIKLSGNVPIIVILRDKKGRSITFAESARLLPDSLAKIGKSVGREKMDVDRARIGSYSLDTIVRYCFNDCDILKEGLEALRDTLNEVGCDFAYTLASICTRYIRRSQILQWHRFYETIEGVQVYSPKMLQADEFCIPAYFGGRVEVFKAGKFRKLYYYDITSSYPNSMLNPIPAYFREFRPPPKDLERALNICGVTDAKVFIPTGTLYAPVLPVRHQGKLVFPEGFLEGRWTNVELKALWDRTKHNKRVRIWPTAQAVFEPLPFLKPFVEVFYALRQKAIADGDDFRKYAFKIALNSVYGKLAESLQKQAMLFGVAAREAMDEYGTESMRQTNMPGVFALETMGDGPFRHIAAGSYVTAMSRLRLLEGMEHCMRMNGKIYYCDTDSIITDVPAFGLRENKELGMFNLETEIEEAEIYASKVYKLRTKEGEIIHRAKGMPIRKDECERHKKHDPTCGVCNASRESSEERWLSFTQYMQQLGKTMPKPEKEGIYAFVSNINRGRIEPEKFVLKRVMKNPDNKRLHKEGDSTPLYIHMAKAVNDDPL